MDPRVGVAFADCADRQRFHEGGRTVILRFSETYTPSAFVRKSKDEA